MMKYFNTLLTTLSLVGILSCGSHPNSSKSRNSPNSENVLDFKVLKTYPIGSISPIRQDTLLDNETKYFSPDVSYLTKNGLNVEMDFRGNHTRIIETYFKKVSIPKNDSTFYVIQVFPVGNSEYFFSDTLLEKPPSLNHPDFSYTNSSGVSVELGYRDYYSVILETHRTKN